MKMPKNGSPVQAFECAMAHFLMALLMHCITLMTTHTFLGSSKGCNRSSTHVAFSQPIGSWRLNAVHPSKSVCLGRPLAAADKYSTISNSKYHCFKNSMKLLVISAYTIQNSTASWILLSSIGEMQIFDNGKHLSPTMKKKWCRICKSACTQCQ